MSKEDASAAPLAGPADFARRLIDWQRRCGRRGLPWQLERDPYRVWLSEVMLQQTQVATVLSYYPRFVQRFPSLQALAQASVDEVLALWSGLGYYSRARHLLLCAQQVLAQHGGVFPRSAQQLQTLPGIGPSSAAAIAAFCYGERVSILDGNVRRVAARQLAFDANLAQAANQRLLGQLVQALLPEQPTHDDMIAYTQGLMDLGATVCLRRRPLCSLCPVQDGCRAQADGNAASYPVKAAPRPRRYEHWWLLLLRLRSATATCIWLERRAAPGIWAGLYCPPVFGSEAALRAALAPVLHHGLHPLEPRAHSLTHRELTLHPVLLDLGASACAPPTGAGQWVGAPALSAHGLPAPVRRMLAHVLG
ncbi:A/G-specific adenine glycosylase [Hydrogenophaga sp.]|uniref:A/G-specific adenine glycosylase n=1 Tax=Hydrogenophaga sp. TaxID=1904254 RepID=UPI0025C3F713|nr:A/G-specific adenine glycosylase [Hydrogenophaga sp.]